MMVNNAMMHTVVCFCVCNRTFRVETLSDAQSKNNNPVCLVDVNSSFISSAEAQRHRLGALKKTIASLDARVKNETIRLGIAGHKESLTHTSPTRDKHEKQTKIKDSVSMNENVPMKKETKISEGKWLPWSPTNNHSIPFKMPQNVKINEFLNVLCCVL